jgi:hypothetical protein
MIMMHSLISLLAMAAIVTLAGFGLSLLYPECDT